MKTLEDVELIFTTELTRLESIIEDLKERLIVLENLQTVNVGKTPTPLPTVVKSVPTSVPKFKEDFGGGGKCVKCKKKLYKEPAFWQKLGEKWLVWHATPKCNPYTPNASGTEVDKFNTYWNSLSHSRKIKVLTYANK